MGAHICQYGTTHKMCRCIEEHHIPCPTPDECKQKAAKSSAIVFNVTCPVCGVLLKIEAPEGFELWGQVELTDTGCASVTLPGMVVNTHLRQHQEDGSYIRKVRAYWESQKKNAEATLAAYDHMEAGR